MFLKLLLLCIIAFSFNRECQCAGISNFHPLDPLSPREIEAARSILFSARPYLLDRNREWVFNWITLLEPEKSLLLPYYLNNVDPPTSRIPRKARVVVLEKQGNTVDDFVVNLSEGRVETSVRLPSGTQITYASEDDEIGKAVAKRDPRIIERCRQMGWTNMSLVVADISSLAYTKDIPGLREAIRPMQVYFYGLLFEGDNFYAHPFDFVCMVDLATKKVVTIDNLPTHTGYDTSNRDGNVCPRTPSNYDPKLKPANFFRRDISPIRFSQPHGATYTIRGNEVSWQKFKFRVGFNKREGLVIHQVSYKDGAKTRPLFYRLAVSELVVPYGDARPPYHQKFPFDMSKFTIGSTVVDHKVAGLCRGGSVAYVDAFVDNEAGDPIHLPNAVCIFEEDAGLLWAHYSNGKVLHTRSQRLTVMSFSNLDNYDYIFIWHFYQDASIQFEVQLHGSVSTQLVAANVTDPGEFGNLVFPQLNAQYHEHFVSLRIDPEIDGNLNSVATLDAIPLPDPSGSRRNPYGQGLTTRRKVLRNPIEARTKISPETGRTWLMQNPSSLNPYNKKPVGYKLIPQHGSPSFVKGDSVLHPPVGFLDYDTWVLKYKDEQYFAPGMYPDGTSGLPVWANQTANEDLRNTDVVLWYNFGITHIPRTEDFPIMPVESFTVTLKPANFFLENPALDVPQALNLI